MGWRPFDELEFYWLENHVGLEFKALRSNTKIILLNISSVVEF